MRSLSLRRLPLRPQCWFSTYLQLQGFSKNSCRADAHAYLEALLSQQKKQKTQRKQPSDTASAAAASASAAELRYSRLWPVVDPRAMPTSNWLVEFDDEDSQARDEAVGRVLRGNKQVFGSKMVFVKPLSDQEAQNQIRKTSARVSTAPSSSVSDPSPQSSSSSSSRAGDGSSLDERRLETVALEAPLVRVMGVPKTLTVAEVEYLLRDFDVDWVARIVAPKVSSNPHVARFATVAEAHRAQRELGGTFLGSAMGVLRFAMYK